MAPSAGLRGRTKKIVRHRLFGVAVIALLLVGAGIAVFSKPSHNFPATNADVVPYDGRSPRAAMGKQQRVLIGLPRPALGQLPNVKQMTADQQRAYIKSLRQESDSLRAALDARGIQLHNVNSFSTVFNGFAATVSTPELSELASLW